MLYFTDCHVFVGATGIAASSASITQENTLRPINPLNYKGITQEISAGPLKTIFKLNYQFDIDSAPVFHLASGLKNITQHLNYEGVAVSVGGISGGCYLENYSFKISPNQPVSAEASFVSFVPTSGDLRTGASGSLLPNASNGSGLLHGWGLQVLSGNTDVSTFPFYEFGYNFKADWKPIYAIGSASPIQIQLLGIEENFNLISDFFRAVTFSGEDVSVSISGVDSVRLNNLSFVFGANNARSFFIPLSGAKVKSKSVDLTLGDFSKVNSTFTRYF